ncbi:MAG: methionine synthase [Halioglobus sp.]
MSNEQDTERNADGAADSIAATAIIALVVFTLYLWLSGMPT